MIKMTIIIPCYNAEKWLRQCVTSAMNQTYKNVEVILVDNESTDNSLEVARKLQSEFSNLIVDTAPNIYKYSYQEPVEKALSISTGDYFTILGSDDFIHPDYIENICKFIMTVGKENVLALQSPILGVDHLAQKSTGLLGHSYRDLEEFKQLLFKKCPVTTPSIVLSKSLYENGIARWNSSDYLGACDYEMYFNIAHNGVLIYPIQQWLGYYYRWHENQSTWGMHSTGVNFDEIIREKWRQKWLEKKN
jgi:glycosyltransferase involved in cell wall biosynthesis